MPRYKPSNTLQENFGRQEQNFEVHYNDAVQVLAQKYEEQLEALGEEKRQKLEALYEQLVSCGKHLDTCKELTDETQELFLENDKAEFMKVKSFNCHSAFWCLQVVPIWEVPSSLIAKENLGCSVHGAVTAPGSWHGGIDLVEQHNGGKMQKQKFVIWMLVHFWVTLGFKEKISCWNTYLGKLWKHLVFLALCRLSSLALFWAHSRQADVII